MYSYHAFRGRPEFAGHKLLREALSQRLPRNTAAEMPAPWTSVRASGRPPLLGNPDRDQARFPHSRKPMVSITPRAVPSGSQLLSLVNNGEAVTKGTKGQMADCARELNEKADREGQARSPPPPCQKPRGVIRVDRARGAS